MQSSNKANLRPVLYQNNFCVKFQNIYEVLVSYYVKKCILNIVLFLQLNINQYSVKTV